MSAAALVCAAFGHRLAWTQRGTRLVPCCDRCGMKFKAATWQEVGSAHARLRA